MPDVRALLRRRVRLALDGAAERADDASRPDPLKAAADAALAVLVGRADVAAFRLSARGGRAGQLSLLARRVLHRLMYQVLHRQTEFNEASLKLLEQLLRQQTDHDQRLRLGEELLTRIDGRLATSERRVAHALEARAQLADAVERIDSALVATGERLNALDGEYGEPNFDYLALQDRFRGDNADIRERQGRYVSCFRGQAPVLDIGCGRGEFLELLATAGIDASGVDLERSMVEQCRLRGVEAVQGDGLAHLRQLPDGSLGGVFAAQVIEHLHPSRLVTLVELAHRKLRPGGVLVLETVNPMCLVTFASFYVDFTHVKPVHPLALEWLAGGMGFDPVEIEFLSPIDEERRLRPLPALPGAPADAVAAFNRGIAVTDGLLYAHQEYALVARRPPD